MIKSLRPKTRKIGISDFPMFPDDLSDEVKKAAYPTADKQWAIAPFDALAYHAVNSACFCKKEFLDVCMFWFHLSCISLWFKNMADLVPVRKTKASVQSVGRGGGLPIHPPSIREFCVDSSYFVKLILHVALGLF